MSRFTGVERVIKSSEMIIFPNIHRMNFIKYLSFSLVKATIMDNILKFFSYTHQRILDRRGVLVP